MFDFWLRMFNASDAEAIRTIAKLEGVPASIGVEIEESFVKAKTDDEKADVLMKLFEVKSELVGKPI